MEITVASQTQAFLLSCAFGAVLSVLYDLFRIVRILTRARRGFTAFLDVLYFLLCGVFTFAFIMAANGGQVRGYVFLGELLGWVVYHLTLGNLFVRLLLLVLKVVGRFFRFLYRHTLSPLESAARETAGRVRRQAEQKKQNLKNRAINRKKALKQEDDLLYNKDDHTKVRKDGKKQRKKNRRAQRNEGTRNAKKA